ncbi:hypothetical protein UFOVP556_14 [uncultured Caudovirales phage]|uniref:Uncharacterized protein n=1 Tax=uncultured Caudovirales phage TaxID=2100421 RepID=A0A6J5MXD8_9CAUD|nr:hypothetical protein UFOVP556_14 [uncultured Caudovirales phage]
MAFNLDDYEPVASRLDRFLKAHPDARVITDLVHYLSDIAVFKAELWLDGEIIATGWAEEIRGQGNVNKTSHLENCETGAVGRALANAGLSGSDFTKRPSREEMGKVVRMQGDTQITEPSNLASDKQLNMIRAVCKSMGRTVPSGIQGWTKREASQFIDTLKNGEQAAPQYETPEEPF